MDMTEVATFFKDLISTKTLNIKTLPMIGFDFLSNYFLSINEQKGFIEKIKAPAAKPKANTGWFISWGASGKKKEEEKEEPIKFKITAEPHYLVDLEIIWTLALEALDEEVQKEAIVFLVSCYIEVDEEVIDKRIEFQNIICQKCFDIINDESSDATTVKRCIQILKNIV